jgi:hypothetical protein
MKMRTLFLLGVVVFSACIWSPRPSQGPPVEDDRSIVFPQFFEQDPVAVGTPGGIYELDGEVLRAIMIAANDFLPPGGKNPPCRSRQEAHFYRVIRQGGIIFVYVHENHAYCGRQYPAPDSGAKYAISTDGRILRRVIDGQPMGPIDPVMPETSDGGFLAEPGVSPTFDAIWNTPSLTAPSEVPDGGLLEPPDGGLLEPPDSGPLEPPDGGPLAPPK